MNDSEPKSGSFSLMARYNQLGRLLPKPDEFDTGDVAAVAEAKTIIAEMSETKAAIDALLDMANM